MHTLSTKRSTANKDEAVTLTLTEARFLHRLARSHSLAKSLPVLRRLIDSRVIRGVPLPELRRTREIVKRKHLLHLLAIEAGHSNWVEFKYFIENNPRKVKCDSVLLKQTCGPNLWFSSFSEAEDFTLSHGGHPIKVGKHAMVLQM